ncbi:glyoxalase [Sphingomonas gilva]|uniref:Glyoxalase n=1 Tax=Sphingomonas gilva TaxID=2305907 RepID=A0A396RPK4_9SPHN|nr:VOC family protein [Sphingomonas gilva]RHW17756.1 glyoxalase [Sphingomonas gilva]
MPKATIIPCLRYADAPAAIDFLCDAFGFERRAVYADDSDPSLIHHAQLVFGEAMIMLATAQESDWTRASGMKTVAQAGANTQAPYIVFSDVDGHCARARAAGAEIIMEPEDQDYGGRVYGARDPEGNVWSFGSYDPWA